MNFIQLLDDDLMNHYNILACPKEITLIFVGAIVAITGILLDSYWTQLYWAAKPPYSTGPILVGTAGIFFIFPSGLLILISGIFAMIYKSSMLSTA